MPSLGADMEEGILLEWLTKPGASVHRGDVVAVVETPKSAVEVPVPYAQHLERAALPQPETIVEAAVGAVGPRG